MARCAVIGSSILARNTAGALQEGCVQAKLVDAKDHVKAITLCKREKGLDVIAVFYGDILGDKIDFLQKLRDAMPSVHIRVLKKGATNIEPMEDELKEIPVDEVFSSRLPSEIIAKSIMKKYFSAKDGIPKADMSSLEKLMFGWTITKKEEPN